MESTTTSVKVGKLTPEHFERHPVWTWADDFYEEDLVCPVTPTDPQPRA